MKKNIILIVIDSFAYKYMNEKNAPYLMSLKKESLFCTNMYSQAPFTEAAIMPLMTGRSTFSDGGYINKFEDRKFTVFDIFHECGYETYYTMTPEYFDAHKLKSIDYPYYIFGYFFNCFLNYRLKEYATYENLKSIDMYNLEKNFDIMFNAFISFLEDLLRKKENCKYVLNSGNDSFEVEINLNLLKQQKNIYDKDKLEYIKYVLKDLDKHPLFDVDEYHRTDVKKSECYDLISKKFDKFLNECIDFEKINNKKHYLDFGYILNLFKESLYFKDKNHVKNIYRYVRNRNLLYNRNDLTNFNEFNVGFEKESVSLKSSLNQFLNWILNTHDSNKPFFAKIHADDIHYKTTYFSYDSKDIEKISAEMNSLKLLYSDLNQEEYNGNIAYDFGIKYVDDTLKEFVGKLKQNKVYKDTVVAITADHGYSYTKKYVRENFVNNQYLENYNIPFIMINAKQTIFNNVCSSLDIIPTLLDATDNEYCSTFNLEGESLYRYSRNYALIEYVGMGCPDLGRKNLLLGYIDHNYKLVYEVNCMDDFENGKINSSYNLVEDPLERKNLFGNLPDEIMKEILNVLKERFITIKLEYNELLKKAEKEFSHIE